MIDLLSHPWEAPPAPFGGPRPAAGLPSGLSINSGTGLISGTISSSLSAGLYTSTGSVTDSTNTTKLTLNWTIYPSSTVVLTSPGTLGGNEGDTVSRTLSASYSGSGTLK